MAAGESRCSNRSTRRQQRAVGVVPHGQALESSLDRRREARALPGHRFQVPALEDFLIGEGDNERLRSRGDQDALRRQRDGLDDIGRVDVEDGKLAGVLERQDEVTSATADGDVVNLGLERADQRSPLPLGMGRLPDPRLADGDGRRPDRLAGPARHPVNVENAADLEPAIIARALGALDHRRLGAGRHDHDVPPDAHGNRRRRRCTAQIRPLVHRSQYLRPLFGLDQRLDLPNGRRRVEGPHRDLRRLVQVDRDQLLPHPGLHLPQAKDRAGRHLSPRRLPRGAGAPKRNLRSLSMNFTRATATSWSLT